MNRTFYVTELGISKWKHEGFRARQTAGFEFESSKRLPWPEFFTVTFKIPSFVAQNAQLPELFYPV